MSMLPVAIFRECCTVPQPLPCYILGVMHKQSKQSKMKHQKQVHLDVLLQDSQVPMHPMLELVSNCEQLLTTRYSRRLITMQKTQPYNASEVQQFHLEQGPPRYALLLTLVFCRQQIRGEGPEKCRGQHVSSAMHNV